MLYRARKEKAAILLILNLASKKWFLGEKFSKGPLWISPHAKFQKINKPTGGSFEDLRYQSVKFRAVGNTEFLVVIAPYFLMNDIFILHI